MSDERDVEMALREDHKGIGTPADATGMPGGTSDGDRRSVVGPR
jgi:hypothetical protein